MNVFSEQVQSSRTEQRERTRERVIASAQRLFRADGFRATTVRAIATDADVSVGTVMGVGDKEALLLACFDRWIGDIQRGSGVGEALVTESAAQRIQGLVAPFLHLFESDLGLAREYGAVLARGSHETEVFAGLAIVLTDSFETVFRDAGLAGRSSAAARTTYLSYLGLLLASAATGADMSVVSTQLGEVAEVLLGDSRKES